MRTTVTIDDDLLGVAKSMARDRRLSLGAAISQLIRQGLEGSRIATDELGLPHFTVSPGSRPLTLEDVKKLEDEA